MFSGYLKFFLVPVLVSIALNMIYAATNDPIDGDLTRIGGYSEVDYGWNGIQQEFIDSPVNYADSLLEYDKYYDILIIGDSFTFKSPSSWADYYFELSGLSIIAFPDDKVVLNNVLSSEQYSKHPPKFLVYEVVERSTISRLSGENLQDIKLQSVPENQQIKSVAFAEFGKSQSIEKNVIRRREKWNSLHEIMSQGFHYYSTILNRYVFASNNRVVELALRNDQTPVLFSCRKRDSMLFLEDDIKRGENSETDIMALGKSFGLVQKMVESNGVTKFAALLIPDKLTAYKGYLNDNHWGEGNLIEKVFAHYDLLRLDTKFDELIQAGAVDLYSPNNTHTSSMGDVEIARELIRYLSMPSQ